VTVGICAIYQTNEGKAIFGASDRMITANDGEIEFESPTSKIFAFSNSIAVLYAGDLSIFSQIYQKANNAIGEAIRANPQEWVKVFDAASIYSKFYFEVRNEMVENEVLSSYGLKLKDIDTKPNMMDMLLDKVDRHVLRFPQNEVIIAGIDKTGQNNATMAHIYTIRNGCIYCHDIEGFVAIGSGAKQAESHFMLSKYGRNANEAECLLTVHQAKKKSEISAGVGQATDMFINGWRLGSLMMITPENFGGIDIVQRMDNFYKSFVKQISKFNRTKKLQVERFIASNFGGGSQEPGMPPPQPPETIPTTTGA
jgi:hypothetical protein